MPMNFNMYQCLINASHNFCFHFQGFLNSPIFEINTFASLLLLLYSCFNIHSTPTGYNDI